MKKNFRKYFSLFLFSIFLFPQVEKEIHTLHHADDFHCDSNETHIHLPQHCCTICEFFFPSITNDLQFIFSVCDPVYTNIIIPFFDLKLFSAFQEFVSLRGPPRFL